MILLNEIQQYFDALIGTDKPVKRVFYFTEEGELQDVDSDIAPEEQPFLIVITPSVISVGRDLLERNNFLIYLLAKEDKFEKSTFEIQKELQPIINSLKNKLIDDSDNCKWISGLDAESFHIDPERKMFTKYTGWSISFSVTG
ncbi:MAG: hypothetical protein LBB41_07360 [Prevotellaceae bacterium]|jgi:hypothetical protein|nr:hypothetical protein [Prevotellaceae bacterium]